MFQVYNVLSTQITTLNTPAIQEYRMFCKWYYILKIIFKYLCQFYVQDNSISILLLSS